MKNSSLGFGVTGNLAISTVEAIANRADQLGLATLWFNQTPDGDALLRVAAAQAISPRLTMGVGVINLDQSSADQIILRIQELGIDQSRLIIGIGASAKPSPLSTVREALAELKSSLTSAVVVGSLGPKMRQLGAEAGDGLLFNWLPPTFAAETTAQLREHAAASGNPTAIAATYVRTALGAAAYPVLMSEAAKYSSFPSYAANFARLGITAIEGAVYGEESADIVSGLKAFDGTVDHVIVRAITATDDTDNYLELLDAIGPLAT